MALTGTAQDFRILQPGVGATRGTYLRATPETVSWGELPNRDSKPAVVVSSGSILTLDGVSHEGVLEDQGKDPVAYFGSKGVPRRQVLDDAIDIAAHKAHTGPGPHVVTGPVAVKGAEIGDVLKIETLDLALRVPYGVVSNRTAWARSPASTQKPSRGSPRTGPSSTWAATSASSPPSNRLLGLAPSRNGESPLTAGVPGLAVKAGPSVLAALG